MAEQPIGIRDAKGRKCKVPFTIMRHSNGGFVVVLNNYPLKGSFPNSALSPVLETDVTLEDLADALAISELKDMLNYRLAKIKRDMESRP